MAKLRVTAINTNDSSFTCKEEEEATLSPSADEGKQAAKKDARKRYE